MYLAGILGLLSVIFIFFTLRQNQRALPDAIKQFSNIEERFASLKKRFDDDSQYFRFSNLGNFKEELISLKYQLQQSKNIFLRRKVRKALSEIEVFENNLFSNMDDLNQRFFQKEEERASHIFRGEDGKPLLTNEQIKAVLCNNDRNLIIAGAGSGKTRVIDFKVRYLVNHKKVSPSKIILLSFSRKSAGDLVKKISENVPGIDARTIHSFSSQVAGRHGKKLFDESNKEFDRFVIKALVETLKEEGSLQIFDKFYNKFFSDVKPLIFYNSLDELREDLKKSNSRLIATQDRFEEIKAKRTFKTLKGEYVRSVDERYIADFLYLRDINYEYEKKYPYLKDLYYPDFYLTDYDIYLEHFAITANGTPPPFFKNPRRYLEGIKWKQNLHEDKNTRMIETYSYLLNDGDSSAYLTKVLMKNGIEVQSSVEDENASKKISKEFARFFSKFYSAYKLSGLSIAELKVNFSDQKNLLFLQLFGRFLRHFEQLAEAENKMDFTDMIITACEQYKNEYGKSFEYIIVDEFQDTSNVAMKLLNEVYQISPNSTLLCVGDDWQSIYGFNGSDVSILSDYERRYSGVSIQKLNDNFRSHSRIVELGKVFISKNPAQIRKDVVSKNTRFTQSEIDFLSFEEMEDKIKAIPHDESIFVLYRYNDDCPAGVGVFREYFERDKNWRPVKRASCTKNISLMTIHGSKGLEARHVFVLFPDGVTRKFPSEIEDHYVFNMLKTNADNFPFSEERRLMYVAITRAEQNLYFVSSNKNGDPNSVFWDELRELV